MLTVPFNANVLRWARAGLGAGTPSVPGPTWMEMPLRWTGGRTLVVRKNSARHPARRYEVRAVLADALPKPAPSSGLGSRIHARCAALGGMELELPAPPQEVE